LGGALTHSTKSGVSHFACDTDKDCLLMIRELLNFYLAITMTTPQQLKQMILLIALKKNLNTIIPDSSKKPYDMKELLSLLLMRDIF